MKDRPLCRKFFQLVNEANVPADTRPLGNNPIALRFAS